MGKRGGLHLGPDGRPLQGRKRGTKNKKTVAREMVGDAVYKEVRKAIATESKKAVGVLNDLMKLWIGIAAKVQMEKPLEFAEDKLFRYAAGEAFDCAKELAPYQNPTFKAISLQEVPPPPPGPTPHPGKTIDAIANGSQTEAANAYMRLVRGDPKAA